MNPHDQLAQRVTLATHALLGQQHLSHQVLDWCRQYRDQCEVILSSRGVSLMSIAVVGAKGQGKTWISRQLILDQRVAQSLPSGVLSSEATTHLHWIGPTAPDQMNSSIELYHPCPSERMLPLRRPYMLLDTPGITDDDPHAAKIAKEAMGLAPIKLMVARRDQLRGAINSYLAFYTEGSICVPIVTCVPLNELPTDPASGRYSDALRSDLDQFCQAMRQSAPMTRLLEPILVPDFEADGDEAKIGLRFAAELQSRLQNESLDDITATRANRLAAAGNRLRSRIGKLLEVQLPQLSSALHKLHAEAESLPTQTIETVLGSREVLQSAVRSRLRAQMISDTSMLWFPYRTVLTILGLTHGAWDRLLLSMSGSLPSIFGTFAAWARNVQQSRKITWEMHEGIRERLKGQIADRLEPVQSQFYRAVSRIRGSDEEAYNQQELKIRLTGVEELQSQSRTAFEWSVDRFQMAWLVVQLLALVGTGLFWVLMAGPIVSIYRQYIAASYETLTGASAVVDQFPHPAPSLLLTSVLLSIIPVVIYAMVVLSWCQRKSRIARIADVAFAEQLKLVEDLKRQGVITLRYDDPLLEHAEFLVNLSDDQ